MMDLQFQFQVPEENKLMPLKADELYDVMILGAGPAGITAAIYAVRKGMKTALVTQNIGGQVLETYSIENYSGYRFIEGSQLAKKFFEQIRQFPLFFKENVNATRIERDGRDFRISLTDGNAYKARAVIAAAGKSYRKLGVPGEKE
ncbi:MAG TPA: FAD-dependent oxidoreductase, partial [bacterium]|nr:FAD-dependent oxidoreductase [bacterium]